MKRHTRTIACGALLGVALLAAACGGKQSMASKSAAAYREAGAKGIQVAGGHEHAGHAATDTSATTNHAAHGAAHGKMAPADHATMGHEAAASADAHAQHRAMPRDQHAAMQHPASAAGTEPHAQHGAMQTPAAAADPHAGHTMSAATAPAMPMGAPRSNSEMQRVQPASTLRGDAFDAPAPAAVSEAAKATQGGGHEGHVKKN